MSDNVGLTECWCGYQAAGVSDLMSHQLYCDPHNTTPKVIDDQRKRIAELEAQLAECRKIRSDYSMGVDPIEYNEMCHKTAGMHDRLVEAEAQIVELEKDAAILDWMADNNLLEGFVHVDYDVHEVALWIAEERSADAEPTVEDYRLALRRLIRAAMDEERQYVKDLQGEEDGLDPRTPEYGVGFEGE